MAPRKRFDKRFVFMLTHDEWKKLVEMANALHETPSSLLRQMIRRKHLGMGLQGQLKGKG